MARHTAKSHKIRKVEILVIQILIYGFAIVTPLVIFVIMFILVSKFDLEKTLPAMKEEIAKRKAQTL